MTKTTIGMTGATGYVGKQLAERLLSKGLRPLFVGRTDPGLGDFIPFDLTDPTKTVLPPVDLFIHVAAYVPPTQSEQQVMACENTNGFGTMQLLEALNKGRLNRFVNISSCHIWDPGQPEEIKNIYEGSKLSGELFLNAYRARYDFEAVNLRLGYVYGPGMKHGRMFRIFLEAALAGRPIRLFNSGEDEVSLIYCDDAVDAIIAAIEAERLDGSFEICNRNSVKTAEIARAVLAATKSVSQLEFVAGSAAPFFKFDSSLATRTFGFDAKTPLHRGIQSILEADYPK